MRWCQLLLLARLTRRAAHVVGRGRSTADALLDAMLDEEDQLVADGWAGRVSAQCEVLTRVEQLLAAALPPGLACVSKSSALPAGTPRMLSC